MEIGSLDDWLRAVTEDLPPVARRYELRCHPDVYLALLQLAGRATAPEFMLGTPGLYGTADVVVHRELGSGGWELYRDGELLRRGRLGEEVPRG